MKTANVPPVVATEVRNLAQRSAAAKEIKSLIGDSVDKVEAGSKQVDQASAAACSFLAKFKHALRSVMPVW